MFGRRFFGARFYGSRYFGDGGAGAPPVPFGRRARGGMVANIGALMAR